MSINQMTNDIKESCEKEIWLNSPYNYYVKCGFKHLEEDGGKIELCEECKTLEQMNLYLAELKKAFERNDYGFAQILTNNFSKYLEGLRK
jgi:hypothetical protein